MNNTLTPNQITNYPLFPNARNAYELMEAVNKELLAEPARLNMRHWIAAYKNLAEVQEYVLPSPGARRSIAHHAAAPQCGTVACYAGWVANLTHRSRVTCSNVEETALRILAGDEYDRSGLRFALHEAFNTTSVFRTIKTGKTAGRRVNVKPGTRRYAGLVVQRFKSIMAQFEGELRTRPVTVPLNEGL